MGTATWAAPPDRGSCGGSSGSTVAPHSESLRAAPATGGKLIASAGGSASGASGSNFQQSTGLDDGARRVLSRIRIAGDQRVHFGHHRVDLVAGGSDKRLLVSQRCVERSSVQR